MADSALLERIRKIMSKTDKVGCTQAEADSALAMATRLMAEHNLTMDDVKLVGVAPEEQWCEEEVHETGKWVLEDNLVYNIVRDNCFVEGFFGRNGSRKVLMLFGRADNVATARFMFTTLRSTVANLWHNYRSRTGVAGSERRVYMAAALAGFRDKMKDSRKAMAAERDIMSGVASGGTALAIKGIEEKTLAAYQAAHHTHSKSSKANYAQTRGSQSTYDAGYRAGRSININ